jgi:hypothetical protein
MERVMKQHTKVMMKAMFVVLFLSLSPLSNQVWALAQEFPVKDISHLLINSEEATITMTSSPSTALKIQIEADGSGDISSWVSMDSSGDTIRITDKSARPQFESASKSKNAKPEAKHAGKIRIDISGAAVATEIHLLEGSVLVQRWNKEVYAHVQRGKVVAQNNTSSLVVHVQKGEVSISNHQGKVIVDNVQATSSIKDLNGDLELQSFMGDATIEKATGSLLLNSAQGNVKVVGGSGSLQFDLVKGSLTTQSFEGRVEGHSQEGSVAILGSKDPDVNIRTQSGRVTVNTAANSGALLNLASAEGEIYVPSYLHVGREGASRSLRARLKGDAQKGTILVRSQDGNITVK